jgi:hypothetical protein
MKTIKLEEKDYNKLFELLHELKEDYSIRNSYGNSFDDYFMEYLCCEDPNHPDNLNVRATELLSKIN